MSRWIFAVLSVLLISPLARGEVRLPKILSDHLVLQQQTPAHLWGWADPGEAVVVSLDSQQARTQAGPDGSWEVFLEPPPAGGPYQVKVEGNNTLVLQNVLVGEVWVASGQSNMAWPVVRSADAQQEIAAGQYPQIRIFTVQRKVSEIPLQDVEGEWQPVSPETIAEFSAVAYFFGRELHRERQVPVGLIQSAWGGTPAEAWTSREALENDLSLHPVLWNWKKILLEYPFAWKRFQEELAAWEEEAARARAQGKTPPSRPREPQGPGHPWTPSGLFNAMIAPLTPYAIRGAIWYQGESNAQPYRSLEYRRLFTTLIEDWRSHWNQGPFPFLFVQLANFRAPSPEPVESSWAELREAQSFALSLPNTGMAVAIDIGEADDIHPRNKQQVGRRLALAAQAVAYGQPVVHSGPRYRGMIREGNRIRLLFDHTGGGLVSRSGTPLRGFAIAGRDRRFVWAEARIEKDTVVVSSPQVPDPVAVRYAWADNPDVSLYNREGLPASPFRTDSWSPLLPSGQP